MFASTTRDSGTEVGTPIVSGQGFFAGCCWFDSEGRVLFLCSGDTERCAASRNGFNMPEGERSVFACCLRPAAFELGDGAFTSRDASTRLLVGDETSIAE